MKFRIRITGTTDPIRIERAENGRPWADCYKQAVELAELEVTRAHERLKASEAKLAAVVELVEPKVGE